MFLSSAKLWWMEVSILPNKRAGPGPAVAEASDAVSTESTTEATKLNSSSFVHKTVLFLCLCYFQIIVIFYKELLKCCLIYLFVFFLVIFGNGLYCIVYLWWCMIIVMHIFCLWARIICNQCIKIFNLWL